MQRFRVAALAVLIATPTVAAAQAPTRAEVQALEQKVKALESKLEANPAAFDPQAPVLSAGGKGFALTAADKSYELKLRGVVHVDARYHADNDEDRYNDTLLLRRVRPIFEGTVGKYYGFRFMPDFAGNNFTLLDAHVDANYTPWLKFRFGKFKGPVGLERLQSAADMRFVERGLPTNLAPNRDIGLQVHGDVREGVVSYSAGAFNGAPDGGSSVSDISNNKELEARVFVTPFKQAVEPLQKLSFGVAGTYGQPKGAAELGPYRSQAQSTFFSYRGANATTGAGPVVASGDRYRLAPQGYWYWKSLGVIGEYTSSTTEVALDANEKKLTHDAWQLLGSWVITGEDNSFKSVVPNAPFDPWKGKWGAWEVVARYGELDVDDDAFPIFANPAASATKAKSFGLGLNWYVNNNVRIYANYENTEFDGGKTGGGDRETEHAIFGRTQVAF